MTENNRVRIDPDPDHDLLFKHGGINMTEDNRARIDLDLDLDDDLLFKVMLMAHQRDITLNHMIEHILQEFIDTNPDTDSGSQ